jgi:phage terminase large subunit-like protein
MRREDLLGLQEGLKLGREFVTREAETAFLTAGIAKHPYQPQIDIFNSDRRLLALFGGNRCLGTNSLVMLPDGTEKRLRDVERNDVILGFDWDSSRLVPVRVNGVFFNAESQLQRYKHSFGILECTASHKVLCVTDAGDYRWIRAVRAAKLQYMVMVLDSQGKPAYSVIEYLGEAEDFWEGGHRSGWEHTMDLSVDHPDHTFIANRAFVKNSGKSLSAAVKMAWDSTGLYPDWYRGPKTVRGIDAWVVGDTAANTRDNCQRKLFGPDPNRPGWSGDPGNEGLIPSKYIIGKPSRISQPPGCYDTVRVKHVPSDTTSIITFKSHQMERSALSAWHGDRVWVDEECPKDILQELIMRVLDRMGQVMIAMCPMDGPTPTVKFIKEMSAQDCTFARIASKDIKHLDQAAVEGIRRMFASDPAALLARLEGIESINTGLIFPFKVEDIIYDPCKTSIPISWPQLGAYDPGWRHPTGAVGGALDPMSDIDYVYVTYEKAGMPYHYHHGQLSAWGDGNMTFMIDPAGDQSGQATGEKIYDLLCKLAHGNDYADEIPEEMRKYIKADNSFRLGMNEMWNRFSTGTLKINKNCRRLLEQYESYAWDKDGAGPRPETDEIRFDIITALRYQVMGLRQYAHRVDESPPWSMGLEAVDAPIPVWTPYRAGGR